MGIENKFEGGMDMFIEGQKVMLKTFEELVEEFGMGGKEEMYDILTDPPITDAMEEYLGTEVTIKSKCEDMNAWHIKEDEEGWGFPTVAFIIKEV
jgi:hypothetical protein